MIAPDRIRIVRHASAQGAWEMAFCAPHPRLRGLVDTYAGYDESNTRFTRRHELPSIQAVLIVNLGAPITIVDTAGQALHIGCGDGFGAGLSEAYATSESNGSQRGLQVMFTPLGAWRFFRMPMHHLANRVFALHDLLGHGEAATLIMRLQEANGWQACFALLDGVIATRLAEPTDTAGSVAWALRQLARSHGGIGIAALAGEIGCSRKHLATQFHEHVGLAPKTIARILRFQQALQLVNRADRPDWAEIAQAAGYFDQAHFSRDFRRLSGLTPGAYLRQRLPDQNGLPVD